MNLYGQKSSSTPQKALMVGSEVAFIVVSYGILFGPLLRGLRAFGDAPSVARNATLFTFNVVVFARLLLTFFLFLRRSIPWDEAAAIPCAFALYFVGFPLFARPADVPFGFPGLAGLILFAGGSIMNTYAEHQRRRFKLRPENAGRLYTGGLFAVVMHPNYFGDLLWVTGYACVTHNVFASSVPALLFCFFYFYNAPKLDRYLRQRYGADFAAYERRTRRLILFILCPTRTRRN